jgi:hypothetical protein
MITPKLLQAKYPYMWAGKHIGISIPKGWMLIFEDLCDAIDQILGDDRQGFHWSQVKEKFGAGRFYYDYKKGSGPLRIDVQTPAGVLSFANEPEHPKSLTDKQIVMRNTIFNLIQEAESKTNKTCICCGNAGHQVQDGWILTLCDKHERIHRSDKEDGLDGMMWFDPEDQAT